MGSIALSMEGINWRTGHLQLLQFTKFAPYRVTSCFNPYFLFQLLFPVCRGLAVMLLVGVSLPPVCWCGVCGIILQLALAKTSWLHIIHVQSNMNAGQGW